MIHLLFNLLRYPKTLIIAGLFFSSAEIYSQERLHSHKKVDRYEPGQGEFELPDVEGLVAASWLEGIEDKDLYHSFDQKINLHIRMVDLITDRSITGNISIIDLATDQQISYLDNRYQAVFEVIPKQDYLIIGKKKGFESNVVHFNATHLGEYAIEIPLLSRQDDIYQGVVVENLSGKRRYKLSQHGTQEVEEDQYDLIVTHKLENILFPVEGFPLVDKESVKKLAVLLQDFWMVNVRLVPYVEVDQTSYITMRSEADLRDRGQQMVDEVIQHLVQCGISKDRIISSAYKESDLRQSCEKKDLCLEQEHDLVGRVEFLLTSY